MKKISILGSTGSIGVNTLNVIRDIGHFQVIGLAAKQNIDLLEQQAKEFNPKIIGVHNKSQALLLQKRLPHIKVVGGLEGLQEVAADESADFVVSAMSGTLGLIPTIAAIQAGKNIGLANKEAPVSGGSLVMSMAKEKGVKIIPIDSEHSAIFQCLNGASQSIIKRIILTASGGPFRNFNDGQIKNITVEAALKHPSWLMGPKVTIDCSTLMNKGLEVIEAHWLFDIPLEKIEVIIHPQSIIHSLAEFVDHSILAQMNEPDMRVPIQYALTYPERFPNALKTFDFFKNSVLQFFTPDYQRFPCLQLAFHALKQGGSLSCYMNAANEVLVERFLNRAISWKAISDKLEKLMAQHRILRIESIEDVLDVDSLAREEAKII